MAKIPERPVYEADQVILEEDLKTWWQHFREIEEKLASMGAIQEARLANLTRQIFSDMSKWRNEGKPPLSEWAPRHKWEE